MKNHPWTMFIGIIEICIGSVTLVSNYLFILLSINHKSLNVLIFVIVTGCISSLLGIGILKSDKTAYKLLLYFSSVIILSKLMVFMNILQFNGELEISIHRSLNIPLSPAFKDFMNGLKNTISIFYHGFIIYVLRRKDMQEIFLKS